MDFLNFPRLPPLAVAAGATTPDAGDPGALLWSTTEAAPMYWDGDVWAVIGVPGTPPITATKWRINVSKNRDNGNQTGVTELEFRTDLGVPETPTGGNAYADGYYAGGYEPDKAFDGNTATVWLSHVASMPHYIEYEFAAPRQVTQISILPRGGGWQEAHSPENFTIEYHDGTDWVVAETIVAATGWADGVAKTFSVSTG